MYPKGSAYDAKWAAMERSGAAIHGEADLVEGFEPGRVLDAGCGTGRVAIELARRGIETVGVDADPQMLRTAESKAPDLQWVHADLAADGLAGELTSGAENLFDLVVAAGNVMIFVDQSSLQQAIRNVASTLRGGGNLVAGFQLEPGGLALAGYDALCSAAGLALEHRWSTWSREAFEPPGSYAVSVHRKAM